MVLVEQIEALLDFLEGNRELALGYLNRSKEGRSLSKRYWTECANILNAISPNCPHKSPEDWRTYYNEFKFKTLKKIKSSKAEQRATGGGVAQKNLLTNSQERLFSILGRDVGDPLPGVRHNPLVSQVELPDNPNNNVILEYEVVTEEPLSLGPGPFGDITNEMDALAPGEPVPGGSVEPVPGGSVEPVPGGSVEPVPGGSVEQVPGGSSEPAEPLRQRRQRHARRQKSRDPDHNLLEASQERLERIEQRHTEATSEQARAINRLAAAVERVAERLSEPLTIIIKKESPSPKKKRQRRQLIEEDSE